ncbi:MAG: hypothetical protein ACHQUC_03110 [Chlamydiales bacterium]
MDRFREAVELSRSESKKFQIMDVDLPIWRYVLHIIAHNTYGKEPSLAFDAMRENLLRIRKNRREFQEASKLDHINYLLYRLELNGRFTLVAGNVGNDLLVVDEARFKESSENRF